MRLLADRKYKTGSGWAFWRWTDVPCPLTNLKYLVRLHLIKLPSGRATMLHWILRKDTGDRHDHPVSFFSLILRGFYVEDTPEGLRAVCWWNWKRATDTHRIVYVHPGTLTLVFAGPKVREWGFHTETGWVHWKDYKDEPQRRLG